MRRFTWLAGLAGSGVLALLGAVDGCSSSSDHPAVLDGTYDSGRPSSSSGGHSGGGSGSGSGSSSGGMTCLTGDGGCTDLQLCGLQVNFHDVTTGTLPTPQGGSVVPGTYNLTSLDIYTSGRSGWQQQTMRLTAIVSDGGAAEGGDGSFADGGDEGGSEAGGGTGPDATAGDSGGSDAGQSFGWESIAITDSSPLTTVSGTTFSLDATHLAFASGCPSSTSSPAGYTATATTLVLIIPAGSTNPGEVVTYTKQ